MSLSIPNHIIEYTLLDYVQYNYLLNFKQTCKWLNKIVSKKLIFRLLTNYDFLTKIDIY